MVLAAVGTICSTANVGKNLLLCQSLIRRASSAGAKLLYLPEASDFIATANEVGSLSRPLNNSVFIEGIKKYAKENNIYVGVGVHESTSLDVDKCMNSNILIDSNGQIVQVYRKVHLFDVNIKGGSNIMESNTTVRGDNLVKPVDTPIGKLGLLTCYDIRFPQVSQMLRGSGAEIICYPSAFTLRTGAAHWEILLRARAIETQCYILAPAQTGSHSSTRASYGHSMIIDPWGTIIAQDSDKIMNMKGINSEEGSFVMADIDLGYLMGLREEIPLEGQRREDIYGRLCV